MAVEKTVVGEEGLFAIDVFLLLSSLKFIFVFTENAVFFKAWFTI